MASSRRLPWRPAALLLPVFLHVACGGEGVPSSRAAEVPDPADGQRRAALPDGRDPGVAVLSARADEADLAARQLALVDPARSVRVDAAAAGSGRLTVDQLDTALLDSNPAVRQAALDALIGESPQVLAERLALLRSAINDPDEATRESVVAVLAGWRDPRAVALLLQARSDESAIVREESREALAELRVQPDDSRSAGYPCSD